MDIHGSLSGNDRIGNQKVNSKRMTPVKLKHKIPFIAGDGIGPEIMLATQKVMTAAINQAYGDQRCVEWIECFAGKRAFEETGQYLPEKTIACLHKHKVAIKGPLTTPVAGGFQSLNVTLRKSLDLYVCMRPVRWFPGLPSPLVDPHNINAVIFRENTEDVYAGLEFEAHTDQNILLLRFLEHKFPEIHKKIPFPDTVGLDIKPISKKASERIMKAAVQWSLDNQRKKITLVHKGNIMKYTEGAFRNWCYGLAEREFSQQIFTQTQFDAMKIERGEEIAKQKLAEASQSSKLIVDDVIADSAFEQAISQPQKFDVIVTTNLNGDYLSDAFAALVGGIGISPGGNINFETGNALFEANHGSAENIAGQDKANPSSLILSSEMLLRFIGWHEAAEIIKKGLEKTIRARQVTFDLHQQMVNAHLLGTQAFTEKVIENIMQRESSHG